MALAWLAQFLTLPANRGRLHQFQANLWTFMMEWRWDRPKAKPMGFWPKRKAEKSSRVPGSMCKHACVCAWSFHSCPTLCDPMDCGLPGSSVHGILQARLLEWVAMPSSMGSSQARGWHLLRLLHLQADYLPLNHRGSSIWVGPNLMTSPNYIHNDPTLKLVRFWGTWSWDFSISFRGTHSTHNALLCQEKKRAWKGLGSTGLSRRFCTRDAVSSRPHPELLTLNHSHQYL